MGRARHIGKPRKEPHGYLLIMRRGLVFLAHTSAKISPTDIVEVLFNKTSDAIADKLSDLPAFGLSVLKDVVAAHKKSKEHEQKLKKIAEGIQHPQTFVIPYPNLVGALTDYTGSFWKLNGYPRNLFTLDADDATNQFSVVRGNKDLPILLMSFRFECEKEMMLMKILDEETGFLKHRDERRAELKSQHGVAIPQEEEKKLAASLKQIVDDELKARNISLVEINERVLERLSHFEEVIKAIRAAAPKVR